MFMGRKIQYYQERSHSKLDQRFNAIPTKLPASYSMGTDKLILKFIWIGKKTQNSQHSIEGKNKIG